MEPLEPRLFLSMTELLGLPLPAPTDAPAVYGPQFESTGEAINAKDSASAAATATALPGLVMQSMTAAGAALTNSYEGINFDQDFATSGSYHNAAQPSSAAGLTQVLLVVNSVVEWHTKDGVTQHSQSLADFFAPLGAVAGHLFDPKAIYDAQANRFVLLVIERQDTANGDATNASRILVAASNSGDANGSWSFQAINSKLVIGGTDTWADYPVLATDPQAIYVTTNQYGVGASGEFKASRLWIMDKAAMYSGGAATVSVNDAFGSVGLPQAATAVPAHVSGTTGIGGTVGTFLVSAGWVSGVTDYLSVIRVDNPLGSPVFTNQFIYLGNIDNTIVPVPSAPQSGSSHTISTGDHRVQSVVWRDGRIYAVNTIVPPAGPDAGQATVHWYVVDTSSLSALTLVDQGNVGGEEIAAGTYTFNPSIAADSFGDFGISFAASGTSIYPGAYYTAHQISEPASTTELPMPLAAGQDYFYRASGGQVSSWGPYSSLSLDPATEVTFWAFNQYAQSRGTILPQFPAEDGRWGTRWGSFRASSVTPIAQITGPYSIPEGSSATLGSALFYGPDSAATYRWDLNGDGNYNDATGPSPTVSWLLLNSRGISDGPSDHTIALQVLDSNNTVIATATSTLSVYNIAPTVFVVGPTTAPRDSQRTLSLLATDPSGGDLSAGFTFTIDWDDGTPLQLVTGPSGTGVTHTFSQVGQFDVQVTATDRDGGVSDVVTHTVTVSAVQLAVGDDLTTSLVWNGTDGIDQVNFEQIDPSTIRVTTLKENNQATNFVETFTGVTGHVQANGNKGNDTLDASGLLTTSATLDGGAGNNTLYGGGGGDFLFGGSNGGEGLQGSNVIIAGNGDNVIVGNGVDGRNGAEGGKNLIVGGTGNDVIFGSFINNPTGNGAEGGKSLIVGGGGSDAIFATQLVDGTKGGHGSILVAGATSLSQAALAAVLSEWTSSRSYTERIANITGFGTGPRSNGNNYLQPGVTVFNDQSVDQLIGDSKGELNWLLLTLAEDLTDRDKPGEIKMNTP